jgi:hypothetical protein
VDTIHRPQTVFAVLDETDVKSTKKYAVQKITLGLYLRTYVSCRNVFSLCGVLIICLVGHREEGALEMKLKEL